MPDTTFGKRKAKRSLIAVVAAVLVGAILAVSAYGQSAASQEPGSEGWQEFPATWAWCQNFYGEESEGWTYWCYLDNDQQWIRMNPHYWEIYAQHGPTG